MAPKIKIPRSFMRNVDEAWDSAVIENSVRSNAKSFESLSQTAGVRAEKAAANQTRRQELINRNNVSRAQGEAQKEADVRHAFNQQDRLDDFRKRKLQNRLGSDLHGEMKMRQGMGDLESQGFATQKDADITHRRESYQALRERRQGQLNQENKARQSGVDDAIQQARANELEGRSFADIDGPRSSNASSGTANASPSSNSAPSMDEARMKKKGKDFSSQYNYIKKQQGNGYDYDNIMKGYTDPTQAHQHIAGLTGKTADEVGGMTHDQMRSELGAALHRRSSNATFGDKIGYHKVPQTAVGVGATAFLISKMSESKGQMSNNQLYGQSSPYGN